MWYVEHKIWGYWMHFGRYATEAEAIAACDKAPGASRYGRKVAS